MDYTRVLSDHRFTKTQSGFSAQDLLSRLNSPRLHDMPCLGEWIDGGADEAGISRELLCCIPQKEQSALTKATLSAHALSDFCGYDGGDGIPQPGTEGPEAQLHAAAKSLRYWFDRFEQGHVERCGDGDVTPANAATFALYRYTPSRSDKANLAAIWAAFQLGDRIEETTMLKIIAPVTNFATAATNQTLHGRSVYNSADVPGHNVFKGWSTWVNNGHRGVGDGLDIAGSGWRTPVVAAFDGTQTIWQNDATKKEVVYLEGGGMVAVYAHVNAVYEGTGKHWRQGETIGVVRGDLNSPHLHFELWIDGKAVAAQTPELLRAKMLSLFETAPEPVGEDFEVVACNFTGYEDKVIPCNPQVEGNVTRVDLRPVIEELPPSATGYCIPDPNGITKHPDGRWRIYVEPKP